MFNVTRSQPAPQSILDGTKNHNQPDILSALNVMFYSKCYICEIKDPEAFAVEHFDAENNNRTDWENLYFACHRCNSNLKGANYNNLLDPADANTDVFRLIHHRAPSTPNAEILINKAHGVADSASIHETVELISRVFNDDTTGNRNISRTFLRKRVFRTLSKTLKEIMTWCDDDTPIAIKTEAEQQIIHYLRVEQEFSAFVRWLILDDITLRAHFEQYIID